MSRTLAIVVLASEIVIIPFLLPASSPPVTGVVRVPMPIPEAGREMLFF